MSPPWDAAGSGLVQWYFYYDPRVPPTISTFKCLQNNQMNKFSITRDQDGRELQYEEFYLCKVISLPEPLRSSMAAFMFCTPLRFIQI